MNQISNYLQTTPSGTTNINTTNIFEQKLQLCVIPNSVSADWSKLLLFGNHNYVENNSTGLFGYIYGGYNYAKSVGGAGTVTSVIGGVNQGIANNASTGIVTNVYGTQNYGTAQSTVASVGVSGTSIIANYNFQYGNANTTGATANYTNEYSALNYDSALENAGSSSTDTHL